MSTYHLSPPRCTHFACAVILLQRVISPTGELSVSLLPQLSPLCLPPLLTYSSIFAFSLTLSLAPSVSRSPSTFHRVYTTSMKPSVNRGNTVDLATVRAKVAKVKQSKKARQAARRRLALERAAAAAAAAEAARAAALRCWDTEEKRLEALANRPEPSARRVQFSQTCTVTEIPVVHAHDLPDPVISETRLEDGPREVEEDEGDELNSSLNSGVPFNSLELSNEDEDDEDYSEDMDSEEGSDSDESDPVASSSDKSVVDSDQPHKLESESDGDSTETDSKATRTNPPRIARTGALEFIQTEAKSEEEGVEEETEPPSAEPNGQVVANGKKDKKRRRRHSIDVCPPTTTANGDIDKETEPPKGKKRRKRRSLSPQRKQEIQEIEKQTNGSVEEDKKKKTNTKSEFSNGQDKNLEDIFSNYSKNKKRKRESTSPESPKAMKMKKNSQGTGSIGARPPRYTNEGFRIYTEQELVADQPAGLGNLNGPCPFDCSCCY